MSKEAIRRKVLMMNPDARLHQVKTKDKKLAQKIQQELEVHQAKTLPETIMPAFHMTTTISIPSYTCKRRRVAQRTSPKRHGLFKEFRQDGSYRYRILNRQRKLRNNTLDRPRKLLDSKQS